jgi:hypothetical protein
MNKVRMKVSEIVENPCWYLQGINLDQGRFNFVKTQRSALSAASFLDNRFPTSNLPNISFNLQELLDYCQSADAKPMAQPRFIFHTAFCCSTLLSRCLDLPSVSVTLKEPEVLMTLANYQRVGHASLTDQNKAMLIYKLVARLLFRPFEDGQTVFVKPTNTVNNIIQPLMAAHPNSKALLLHSDLRSFLTSTLKKGEQGRGFARHLFNIFLMDSAEAKQLSSQQLMRMTDLQIAAITWHLQFEHMIEAQLKFDQSRIRSLHCDRLLEDSEKKLSSIIDHFEASELTKNFAELMANAPLDSDAKVPEQSFTADDRKSQYGSIQEQFEESLTTIIAWAKTLRFKHPYVEKLTNPI